MGNVERWGSADAGGEAGEVKRERRDVWGLGGPSSNCLRVVMMEVDTVLLFVAMFWNWQDQDIGQLQKMAATLVLGERATLEACRSRWMDEEDEDEAIDG
jgi:hypothetical protein